MVFLATSCTKEKVIHQACQLLKCENKARGLEIPYEIRLPVEVYKRVLVARTSSPSRAPHHKPFARLPICQHFSFPMLHFPMRMKTIFDDIQAYSVLNFPSSKPPLNSQKRTRESEICNASAILEVVGKLNFY